MWLQISSSTVASTRRNLSKTAPSSPAEDTQNLPAIAITVVALATCARLGVAGQSHVRDAIGGDRAGVTTSQSGLTKMLFSAAFEANGAKIDQITIG